MARRIYEKSRLYSALKMYADHIFRTSYRRVEVSGRENIPDDGSVIIAPNHCNSLMDALSVLSSSTEDKVFGARASAFKKPFIANILNRIKILPMIRQRDGIRNVTRNTEIFETIADVLENDVKFCMYCEGTHRTKHSLLPVGKGIARVAFRANTRFGDKKPVYVLPVGLEYGDYFRYRSTSLLQYGEPINVTRFVSDNKDLPEAELYAKFRELLASRMSKLITYIPDDENYEPKWTLAKIATIGYRGTLVERRDNNNRVIAAINGRFEQMPEEMASLSRELQDFEHKRKEKKISFYSLGRRHPVLNFCLKCLLGLLLLPYFLYCTIVCLPVIAVAAYLVRTAEDPAFYNTARLAARVALTPVMIIVWALLAFLLVKPLWLAAVLFVLALPSCGFFYDGCEYLRILVSDARWMNNRSIRHSFLRIKSKMKKYNLN